MIMGQLARTIALVGMMGAGKSSIGRRIAARMGVAFHDADNEIEAAAGRPVPEIFQRYGEAAFRDCERKVISRLLEDPPHVLATGGGAFMCPETRAKIKEKGVSVWMRAPVDVLFDRVKRKGNRPLLKTPDPLGTLERLLKEREPTYSEADIIFESVDGPHGAAVDRMLAMLTERGIWLP